MPESQRRAKSNGKEGKKNGQIKLELKKNLLE
jgi:hypothetical protein